MAPRSSATAASPRTTSKVYDPATGGVIAELPHSDVDAAVRAAQKAAPSWRALTPKQRARVLFDAAAKVRADVKRLAALEKKNTGKPDATGEILYVADVFEYYAGAVTRFFGETVPVSNPGVAFTLREPVGVCGLIVPWNFPAVIAAWKLGPALACGNTVVLKPAPETPLTALELAKLFPPGVVNVVTGGPETGAALVAHPGVRKISFTGSTATGKAIMRSAADTIKRITLELGGKSPNIVFDDADLDVCVEKSVWSVFDNTGQDCCARSRMIVHHKIYDKFVERFIAAAKKIELGPMISERQREKVLSYLDIAKKEGAKVAWFGGVPDKPGYWLKPAVLTSVKSGMRCMQEEIFGPVVGMLSFKTEAEAIALANDTEYGLSGSVWTRDVGRALRVVKAVQAGVLSVNSASSVYLEGPFGGFKASGLGRELGMKALENYSETKQVFIAET